MDKQRIGPDKTFWPLWRAGIGRATSNCPGSLDIAHQHGYAKAWSKKKILSKLYFVTRAQRRNDLTLGRDSQWAGGPAPFARRRCAHRHARLRMGLHFIRSNSNTSVSRTCTYTRSRGRSRARPPRMKAPRLPPAKCVACACPPPECMPLLYIDLHAIAVSFC